MQTEQTGLFTQAIWEQFSANSKSPVQTGRDITAICCSEITTIASLREFHVFFRFWETATYPSPKLTLTLTSHSGKNVGLGEG